ncbi:MAG: hypothetical protein A2Z20_09250 [Bdellovibrionales bacterium RBG_16_40_8]|nr:MAG: hypothetical protein A2Z20_09250 [Bdellovibrionales bacterium RBG_16_40_8]
MFNFFRSILSLLKGMRVTGHYLVRPSTVVTQQYPENRDTLKLSDRTRALLSFKYDENGYHKCTSCHICEEACPNASIHVIDRPKPAVAKNELDHFIWRLDSCTFCNLCVLVCPFQVLQMSAKFESAVYDQRLLIYNLTTYAGATGPVLMKQPDVESRKKLIEPRSVYDGPTSLEGFDLAGIKP